jgi:hypothetical protein
VLYPIELIGGLREKDIIETIRISPRDAQAGFSGLVGPDKVAGKALYHFASFFKRSWRANDILWGRLDGLAELTECLLSLERVQQIVGDERWRDRVRRRFFEEAPDGSGKTTLKPALDPALLFPHAGQITQNGCRQWLERVLSADADVRASALDSATFAGTVDLLIEAAQLEAIYRDLPTVIGDSLDEQAEWNRFQVAVTANANAPPPPPAPPTPDRTKTAANSTLPWIFEPVRRGTLDPFVAIVSAAQRVRDAMDRFAADDGTVTHPATTQLGQFFQEHYRVGSEQILRDIPLPILLQILALSLLVVRNCILGTFDQATRTAIQRNPLYIFILDLPLRMFYALSILWQRAPGAGLAVFVGLAVVSVLALTVGVNWLNQIIWVNGQIQVTSLIVFILIPLLILIAEAGFLLLTGQMLRPNFWRRSKT